MVVILRRPKRDEHFRPWTVPSCGDRVLGYKHPNMGAVFDYLRLDPVDLMRSEGLHSVFAQHMPDGVGPQLRHFLEDDVKRLPQLVVIWRVGRLQYQ